MNIEEVRKQIKEVALPKMEATELAFSLIGNTRSKANYLKDASNVLRDEILPLLTNAAGQDEGLYRNFSNATKDTTKVSEITGRVLAGSKTKDTIDPNLEAAQTALEAFKNPLEGSAELVNKVAAAVGGIISSLDSSHDRLQQQASKLESGAGKITTVIVELERFEV